MVMVMSQRGNNNDDTTQSCSMLKCTILFHTCDSQDRLNALSSYRIVHNTQVLPRILYSGFLDDQCPTHLLNSVVQGHSLLPHCAVNELVPPGTIHTTSFMADESQLKQNKLVHYHMTFLHWCVFNFMFKEL